MSEQEQRIGNKPIHNEAMRILDEIGSDNNPLVAKAAQTILPLIQFIEDKPAELVEFTNKYRTARTDIVRLPTEQAQELISEIPAVNPEIWKLMLVMF